MKIIKTISEQIEDEIDGAEEYAEDALRLKDEYPDLAHVYHEIAIQELRHVELLHGEIVKLIELHRRTKGEPPAAMLAVYDYMHGRMIERDTEVRIMLDRFKR
jgi:hypothetical protein